MKNWNIDKYGKDKSSSNRKIKHVLESIHNNSAVNEISKDVDDNNSYFECNPSKNKFICRLCYNEVIPLIKNKNNKFVVISTQDYDKSQKYLWVNKDSINLEVVRGFVSIPEELDYSNFVIHRQRLRNRVFEKIGNSHKFINYNHKRVYNIGSYHCITTKSSTEKENSKT